MTTFDEAIEDLDAYLADIEMPSDLDNAEIPDMPVVDPVRTNRMFRAMAHIDREVGVINDVAESEIRSIRERVADITAGRVRQRAYLASVLARAAAVNYETTGKASLKLPHGTLTSRKVSTPRIVVLDEDQATLLAGTPLVREVTTFSRSAIKDVGAPGDLIEDQGDVEDGYERRAVLVEGSVLPGVAIDVPVEGLRSYDAKPT